jgi:hypothetical protein
MLKCGLTKLYLREKPVHNASPLVSIVITCYNYGRFVSDQNELDYYLNSNYNIPEILKIEFQSV